MRPSQASILVAEDLAEVAGLGAEDFLNDGRVAQPCEDGGNATAHLAELRRDARDEDGRLVHKPLPTELLRRFPPLVEAADLPPIPSYT
jgi:hypothetical protein